MTWDDGWWLKPATMLKPATISWMRIGLERASAYLGLLLVDGGLRGKGLLLQCLLLGERLLLGKRLRLH